MLVGLLCGVIVLMSAGCAALSAPAEPQTPSPGYPVWEQRQVREHVSFLSGSSLALRALGTPGMSQAMDYVAARMRGYRLQPALSGYRVPYEARAHRIEAAALWVVGADSLQLHPGYDFWPDGRSSAGHVSLSDLHLSPSRTIAPIRTARQDDHGIMVDGRGLRRERLDSLAEAGFSAAFVVQSLAPVSDVAPVRGMVIVQITDATAAWLLGLTREGFARLWEDQEPSVRSVARRVNVRVHTETADGVEAANVVGYLAGREPRLMRDLVVVAANLDAPGITAGERVTDYRQIGTGISALLEIARNEERVSSRFNHPMRSIMFAAFTGSRSGHQGLRAFLDRPVWERGRVRTMIYLGLSEDDEPTVRALLATQGIDLIAVRTTEVLPFERRYVFASERSSRSRSPVPRTDPPAPSPESSVVNARALDVAMDLVRQGYEHLSRHAGMVPIDSVPAAQQIPVDQP